MSNQTDPCGCAPDVLGGKSTLFAVTKIDERGQIVVPKDIRESMGWGKGEKIAMITRSNTEGKPCCVMLVHVDSLSDYIKGFVDTLK